MQGSHIALLVGVTGGVLVGGALGAGHAEELAKSSGEHTSDDVARVAANARPIQIGELGFAREPGVVIGELGFAAAAGGPPEAAGEAEAEPALDAPRDAEAAGDAEAASRTRSRRRRRPTAPPIPRLHADAGMHTVLTARRMIAEGGTFRGSCYAFLSEVFARAGHSGWRRRRVVYSGEREGPSYADLSQVRPGDWLYIVNDPYRTPVGTHSVLFVRWDDRARGEARVISHAGWGSSRPAREKVYDVSRTYRIIRPTL